MRTSVSEPLPRYVSVLVAVVLLVAGAMLLRGTGAAFERRDDFAAQVERGVVALRPGRIAAEWRSEIAAQQHTARRDRIIGVLLIGTGLLAAGTLAYRGRGTRRPTGSSGAQAA